MSASDGRDAAAFAREVTRGMELPLGAIGWNVYVGQSLIAFAPVEVTPLCGPWVCDYPLPEEHHPGDRWRCPVCGTAYRRSRRKRKRPWRNWYAPHGAWRLARWW